MKTIIKANNINFSYNNQIRVLEDINFEVYENDFVGLIGPNGGGKSTLMKIILGLLKPDSGKIEVFGLNSKIARNMIGYVPQYSKVDLDFPISVWEIVLSGLLGNKKMGSFFSKEEKNKAKKVLDDLKILHLKNIPLSDLSGGQRQKVMIARGLVRNPKLLLLDEPTNNIDEESGRNLYDLLNILNKKMAIVVVSHDVDMTSRHIKRIFCLNKKIICNKADGITNKGKDMRKIIHNQECTIH
ncbi:MAG: ABC transporter ATP-binding protein [Patescibacteria group bacterium]|nr:ABC transporter ATP-binding protein [Patescibacteria group bacterium]